MGKKCEKKRKKGKERREAKKVRETEREEQSAKKPDFIADQIGDVRKTKNFEENIGKPVVEEKPVKEKMKPVKIGSIEDLVLDVFRSLFDNLEDRQGQGTMWNREQLSLIHI